MSKGGFWKHLVLLFVFLGFSSTIYAELNKLSIPKLSKHKHCHKMEQSLIETIKKLNLTVDGYYSLLKEGRQKRRLYKKYQASLAKYQAKLDAGETAGAIHSSINSLKKSLHKLEVDAALIKHRLKRASESYRKLQSDISFQRVHVNRCHREQYWEKKRRKEITERCFPCDKQIKEFNKDVKKANGLLDRIIDLVKISKNRGEKFNKLEREYKKYESHTRYGVRERIMRCIEQECKQAQYQQEDSHISYEGRFAIGVIGEVSGSKRKGSMEHNNETLELGKTASGVGGGVIAQYYFAGWTNWFFYSSLVRPGDHKANFNGGNVSSIEIEKAFVSKQWLYTAGLAYQIIKYSSFNLGVGAGVSVVRQQLSANVGDTPAFTMKKSRSDVTPTLFAEGLLALNQHLALTAIGSWTRIPSIYTNSVSTYGGPDFNYRMDAANEWSLMLGIKYFFGS